MASTLRLAVAFSVLLSLFSQSSYAQTTACGNYKFTSNKIFTSCNDLPHLNSFLHWTFDQSTGKLQMAYRHTGVSASSWVAWAINPDLTSTSSAMPGAQSLVAWPQSSGTPKVYTSPIQGYSTKLAEGKLKYEVTDLTAQYLNNDEMIIFATWALPTNSTTILQVWQEGPVSSGAPGIHSTVAANLNAKGTLNLLSGETASTGSGSSTTRKKNIHGVLNVVSWGILMPLGAMVARYLRVFKSADPAWFYLHAACQTSAYAVGVAGWATGLKLGSDSAGVQYDTHRNIGITLFALGTLQVFALLLRPNKDHKFRFYWNMYHHATGYAVIILSIVNIFEGLDILKPNKNWKNAYIGLIIAFAVQAALLEAYTWYVVLKRKKSEKPTHAANGVNGYGA
ncbi:cytochrome b561 and DOMON domain-containing protein At4g17280-like [Pyrus x bretschneideri]|uniref:cytochrome b561 and DOMON domain-containing protein At4g17280-like n=1 Tax=Pyrus x bretschneideri TaxID=225117 RepID=UPI0005119A16|nr:cytochrome b561 and DOMON domain-containing protein At4g17280-like [Pyrus x bretschneideri]